MNLILPVIDHKKCNLCGACIDTCKTHAIAIHDGNVIFIKPDLCNYCADCEGVCVSGAIRAGYEISW